MRNICVLCTFSPGMLTCQPQHQPSAFPTPGSQRGHNRLPTDNGPKQHCCWQWSDFVEKISAADCPMTEPPLPVLPCSHTAQCSVHRGLCCPASYSHAIPLAAAARAPLEQTSSKHAAFSEEQMPYQPFNFNKEPDCVTSLFLETQFLCCLAPALSPTPKPCLSVKFLTFLQILFGCQ